MDEYDDVDDHVVPLFEKFVNYTQNYIMIYVFFTNESVLLVWFLSIFHVVPLWGDVGVGQVRAALD